MRTRSQWYTRLDEILKETTERIDYQWGILATLHAIALILVQALIKDYE